MSGLPKAVGPLEVVLVSRRDEGYARIVPVMTVRFLIGGAALMFALPLAHEVLGTPELHPGFWRCGLLVVLARLLVAVVFARSLPLEAER